MQGNSLYSAHLEMFTWGFVGENLKDLMVWGCGKTFVEVGGIFIKFFHNWHRMDWCRMCKRCEETIDHLFLMESSTREGFNYGSFEETALMVMDWCSMCKR